jgi:hypothetical protein
LFEVSAELAAGMLRLDRTIGRLLLAQLHELRMISIRERIEQKRVNNAEDRRVHPDRERQRQHRDEGKARRFQELAKGEAKVGHREAPSSKLQIPKKLQVPNSKQT